MAAPKTKPSFLQQEQTRAAIQTTQLVKRLQSYALGKTEADVGTGEETPIELDAGRIKAIEILLRKSLPDLASVTVSGDKNADPVQVEHSGSASLAALIETIAERSRTTGGA